jgi:hypothetical protein
MARWHLLSILGVIGVAKVTGTMMRNETYICMETEDAGVSESYGSGHREPNLDSSCAFPESREGP